MLTGSDQSVRQGATNPAPRLMNPMRACAPYLLGRGIERDVRHPELLVSGSDQSVRHGATDTAHAHESGAHLHSC